jgi:hypothetical protein
VNRRAGTSVLLVAGVVTLLGCTGDDEPASATSTSTTTSPPVGTVAPDDPALTELLITADDLPDGFTVTDDVADTITSFCAGQDAAAGLRASGRAVTAFTREPVGASVFEVVFRFEGGGARTFVDQAEALLESCHEVPDVSGLAFGYEPLSEPVAASLSPAGAWAGRFGTSVGSGELTIEVAALQRGDLGALVAVLGADEPRADLDALAIAAFTAAVEALGA